MKPFLAVFAFLTWATLGAQELSPVLQAQVDPLPGAYTSPLVVSVRAPAGASVRYRFLETTSLQTFPWASSLSLEAMAGEHRSYTLRLTTNLATGEALTRDYRYQVSRPVEPLSTIQPVPGVYSTAVTVQPTLPPGWTLTGEGGATSPSLKLDAAPGSRQVFLLTAQGPQDRSVSWSYTIDRRDQDVVGLDVISPLPGIWENPQPLIASFRGFDRVLWSFGPHLDPTSARAYEGPVALEFPGVQTVTLAGHSRAGTWVEKTVTWTNGSAPPPTADWPLSGVRLAGLNLPEAEGWSLSWDEGRSWQPSQAYHQEASSSVSRKVLAVQARKNGQVSRYVWWLDARPPEVPTLQFVGGWNPQLVFSGSTEALHRVSWTRSDGKTVEEPVGLWGPTGSWKVPDGMIGARVVVLGFNGLPGAPAVVGFSETGWSTPGWEPWDSHGIQNDSTLLPLGGRIPPRPGFKAAYEISDRPDVPEPGPLSAWLDGAFLPTVPWGADRTFYARFAWRDDAGLTGPASPVVAVRVDRVPPQAPEVQEVGAQVLVKPAEGEEEGTSLFWAVTPERVDSTTALTFQPYQGALAAEALRSGSSGKLWFHAQAQDRAGNVGPPRLNIALGVPTADLVPTLVQVDPDLSVGESAVEEGGVYPWSQFRLRALDRSRDLWVGVTDLGTGLPADWKTRVQPWTGVLSRAVGKGERRQFLVFWNAKTADGWAWPQPKTLSLTLDQGPPAPPVVEGTWPTAPLATTWTVTLRPGRPGDSLRYSFTTDGSLPADPSLGEAWPGTRSWNAPVAGRIVVRVRFASVSVSGLTVETPVLDPVVIDRTLPAAVSPALEPFTYRSGPLVVPSPALEGKVRYTLTSDGSSPEIPSVSSPSLSSGMTLDGIEGQSVLYRFRWRPFSAAGLPGPVSDTFAVLIDKTATPVLAQVPSSETGRGALIPRLVGFPASGVSSAPVTLKADDPSGVLRYEVLEGIGSPRPVTAQSPAWEKTLVLDGGPGVDRSYVVSVRAFAPDGQPLSGEARYSLRIDRLVPVAPSFELIPDSRRAEAVLSLLPGKNPEEVLYYRWFWESFPQGRGEIAWRSLESDPPRFLAPGGALTWLRVQAYFRDEAGNEGPTTEKTLLVDQNLVYVAPEATGDGTRLRPMGRVADAVDQARRTGKSVIFVASGNYQVTRTLDLGGIQIFGGWKPALWEATQDPSRSLLTGTAPFTGSCLVESGEKDWSMTRIDLATGSALLDKVVVVRGGAVSVRGSTWTWAGASGGWDQVGGSLDGADISSSYTAQPHGTFFDLRSAEVAIRGFNLSASLNQDGVLFSLKGSRGLFQDVAIVSKKSSGFEAVWSATDSRLTIDKARVLAGDGATRSTAFVFKQTEAVFFNTDVSLFGSSSNTGFQTTGGRLEVQKSNLSLLRGDEFNQGLVADHAEIILRAFQIKVETGSYQGGFNLDGGSLTLASGTVQLAGGGQRAWGAQFLSESFVAMSDVRWTLQAKTQGELWILGKPWAEGSSNSESTVTGW